jgi:hypothetical protein
MTKSVTTSEVASAVFTLEYDASRTKVGVIVSVYDTSDISEDSVPIDVESWKQGTGGGKGSDLYETLIGFSAYAIQRLDLSVLFDEVDRSKWSILFADQWWVLSVGGRKSCHFDVVLFRDFPAVVIS